jgi:hypothetical protein
VPILQIATFAERKATIEKGKQTDENESNRDNRAVYGHRTVLVISYACQG